MAHIQKKHLLRVYREVEVGSLSFLLFHCKLHKMMEGERNILTLPQSKKKAHTLERRLLSNKGGSRIAEILQQNFQSAISNGTQECKGAIQGHSPG